MNELCQEMDDALFIVFTPSKKENTKNGYNMDFI